MPDQNPMSLGEEIDAIIAGTHPTIEGARRLEGLVEALAEAGTHQPPDLGGDWGAQCAVAVGTNVFAYADYSVSVGVSVKVTRNAKGRLAADPDMPADAIGIASTVDPEAKTPKPSKAHPNVIPLAYLDLMAWCRGEFDIVPLHVAAAVDAVLTFNGLNRIALAGYVATRPVNG